MTAVLSACVTIPPPVAESDRERNREARAYQIGGGFIVGSAIVGGVAGSAASVVLLSNANEASGRGQEIPIAPAVVASVLSSALLCVLGGYLIHVGNDIIREDALLGDQPTTKPPRRAKPESASERYIREHSTEPVEPPAQVRQQRPSFVDRPQPTTITSTAAR